ncbi:RNA polymerase sigma factor [Asticcacaulis sp.]|uniref:RNA polymerase sigma factor n=1 Tax=Asticcacaulis sp. TaxID=1872648 RepID=UPI0026310BE4|nr:RNA polymerase sigma factor [Asticcacaulis sp.]
MVNEDAFTHMFRTYQREIDSYFLRKTRNRALAEDLTQETFARLAAKIADAADIVQKRPYLYRVAHNLFVDYVRREGRFSVTQPEDGHLETLPDHTPTPEAIYSASQQAERMQAALRRLPLRTRQVFVLTRLDGLSYNETARTLNISESSVQKHLAMATAHLMRHLNDSLTQRGAG